MTSTIITSVITALTSIIVALITAGYFKKFWDIKKEAKSKKDLKGQFMKDEVIHASLQEIKRKYNSDRITITQFHNGGIFYTSSPMQKCSMTYERIIEGLTPISQKYQNILVSNFSWYYTQALSNDGFYFSVYDDVTDLATRSILKSHGTSSHAVVPIFDRDKNLVATLAMDWALNDVPVGITENSDFSQQFKEEIFNEAQGLIGYL